MQTSLRLQASTLIIPRMTRTLTLTIIIWSAFASTAFAESWPAQLKPKDTATLVKWKSDQLDVRVDENGLSAVLEGAFESPDEDMLIGTDTVSLSKDRKFVFPTSINGPNTTLNVRAVSPRGTVREEKWTLEMPEYAAAAARAQEYRAPWRRLNVELTGGNSLSPVVQGKSGWIVQTGFGWLPLRNLSTGIRATALFLPDVAANFTALGSDPFGTWNYSGTMIIRTEAHAQFVFTRVLKGAYLGAGAGLAIFNESVTSSPVGSGQITKLGLSVTPTIGYDYYFKFGLSLGAQIGWSFQTLNAERVGALRPSMSSNPNSTTLTSMMIALSIKYYFLER